MAFSHFRLGNSSAPFLRSAKVIALENIDKVPVSEEKFTRPLPQYHSRLNEEMVTVEIELAYQVRSLQTHVKDNTHCTRRTK